MQSAPYRKNEVAALQALRELDVLDSEPEPEFDAIVQSAARICKVPIALISLLDCDRQWFKAAIGLEGVSQTLRDVSFCAHAVLHEGAFVVEDTLQDARFADNPMVTGGFHIRFYAAVPLCLPNDVRIGTVCVMDRVGRRLSSQQQSALEQLAAGIVRALQGRSALRSLADKPLALESVLEAQAKLRKAISSVDEVIQFLAHHPDYRPDAVSAGEPVARNSNTGDAARRRRNRAQGLEAVLISASALLSGAHRLLQPDEGMTVRQRRLAWRQSVVDAKVAARAALGAVEVLSRSAVEMELIRGK